MLEGQTKGMSQEKWVAAFPMRGESGQRQAGKSEVFTVTVYVYGDKDTVTIGDGTSDPNPWIGSQEGAVALFKLLCATAKDRAVDLVHAGSQGQSQGQTKSTS